jgi:hypothetical protein
VKAEKHTPRLLGAAFLLVIVTSAIGGTVFNSAVGSGSISDILIRISQQPTLMRISILADLANGLAIVVLAVLLYMVLNKQNKTIALIALGWWLAEALFDPISRIGAAALIPLSQDFVKAGAPDHSYYQTFGEFLYAGVARQGYTIHMFFYCAGGILWYYLFYTSKYIPRVISLFGLLAASVGLVGIVLELLGYALPIVVYLPIGLFELTVGFWLMLKGIKESSEQSVTMRRANA